MWPLLTLAFVSSLLRNDVIFVRPQLAPHNGLMKHYQDVSNKEYVITILNDYLRPRSSVFSSREISVLYLHNHVYIKFALRTFEGWVENVLFSSPTIQFAFQFKRLLLPEALLIFIIICALCSVSPFGCVHHHVLPLQLLGSISISPIHTVHS